MQSMKAITKWLLGAALAGAFVLAAPHKAQAQVGFGVVVGNQPAPGYGNGYGYGWQRRQYIEHQRWEAARWRHDRWERDHYRHDRRYYR
jgi:hypothetical protein